MSDTQNYTLGRGKLYFDRFADGTKTPTGIEKYFGNTTELNFSLSSDKLDHFSSEEGVKVKDDSVTLQTDSTGNFACDNISSANLALFFLGEASTVTVGAATDQTSTLTNAEPDTYFQLGTSPGAPSGARDVSGVTAVIGATPLAAAGNWEVDEALGRIHILAEPTDIDSGDDIVFTYDQVAHTREQIVSQSKAIAGAMRFISANPKGKNRDYYIPYCEISPDGDFALKGDDWQSLGFTLEILQRDDDTERLYIDGRPA